LQASGRSSAIQCFSLVSFFFFISLFRVESLRSEAAAALLKQWLRELPEPLLTFDLYQPLLDAYGMPLFDRTQTNNQKKEKHTDKFTVDTDSHCPQKSTRRTGSRSWDRYA
jgi:hypothetical protein